MNIKLAYDFDLGAYKSLFPEITLFDFDKHINEYIDLMVFPGGDDVSLEYYCSRETIDKYKDICYTDRERDDYEVSILDNIYGGNLNVNKILGVCRGMQLINVCFDGKLFVDIRSQVGYIHDRIHQIYHKQASALGFLKEVNSLHHQGIKNIGGYDRRGNRSNPQIIATDKNGYIPEIVSWGERVLGVQFHPEYFWNENPDKGKFREFCYSWIDGKTKIFS